MVSEYLVPALVVATQLALGQPPPGREGGALQQEGSSSHTEGARTHTEGCPHLPQRGAHTSYRGGTHPHRGAPTPHTEGNPHLTQRGAHTSHRRVPTPHSEGNPHLTQRETHTSHRGKPTQRGTHTSPRGKPTPHTDGRPHLTQRETHTSHRGAPTPHKGPAIRAGLPGTSPENHLVCPPHTHTHSALAAPGACYTARSPPDQLAFKKQAGQGSRGLIPHLVPGHGLQGPAQPPQAFQHSQASPECPAPGRTCKNNNAQCELLSAHLHGPARFLLITTSFIPFRR